MSRFHKEEKPKRARKLCLRSCYLTALHLIAIAAVAGNYFYISDSYGIVKISELDHYRQQIEQENASLKKQISAEYGHEQYALQIAQGGKEAKQDMFSVLKKKK